jgi:predicted aminopeptidase
MNSKTLSEKKDSIFIALKEYINDCNHSGIHLLKTENKDFVPNNAYLVPIEIYYSLVPKFQSMLDSCGGDLNIFYREAEKLGKRK